jgi:hypothetical protein
VEAIASPFLILALDGSEMSAGSTNYRGGSVDLRNGLDVKTKRTIYFTLRE